MTLAIAIGALAFALAALVYATVTQRRINRLARAQKMRERLARYNGGR